MKYSCEVNSNSIVYRREDGSIVMDICNKEVKMENTVNKVKMHRTGCNITQEEMAKVLGVHVNTYRILEENPSKFNVEQVKKFMLEINKYDANVTASDIFSI